jgi:hypothetical protein
MNKHHKITALERDQIAWWLACGVTVREMARHDDLTAHITDRINS